MSIAISKIPPEQLEVVAEMVISPRQAFFCSAYIVGLVTDAILFGVIIQLYVQWHMHSRREERKLVRYLVWYLMILGIVSTTFFIAWVFHLFITSFGQYAQFLKMDWATWWFFLNMTVRLPVSSFFAHRAWGMCRRSRIFAIVVGFLFLVVFALSFPIKVVYKRESLQLYLVIAQMGCESLGDIIVTTTIAVGLFRSKTGWKGTDRLITRLLYLVVETQLPPTLLTTTFLAMYTPLASRPLTNFFACAPKAYTLCLMISLNSRQKLRKDLTLQQDYPLSGISSVSNTSTVKQPSAPSRGAYDVPAGPRSSTQIKVTTETSTHVQKNTVRPKYSVNRGPTPSDSQPHLIEVDSEPDAPDGMETDKDSLEGRFNTSEVRLTKERQDV